MTLCSLLEIRLSLVRPEDRAGLEAAERMWSRAGKPTTRRELIAFLEQFLTTAVAESYGYPAIVLRRKREMQRGDWAPQAKRDAAEPPDTAVTSGKIPREWIEQAEQRERAKLRLPRKEGNGR